MELHYLDTALALSSQAGTLLLAGAMRAQEVSHKGSPTDLVTSYDRSAEAVIVQGLKARYPTHRILAEEGGEEEGDADAPRWLVDPLDGTSNFAHGVPFFSVSIACEVRGEVVVGVVHAPVFSWTFAALRGGGATLNGRPLAVSKTAQLSQSLLVTGFPYDRMTSQDNNLLEFAKLERQVHGVRRFGSAALDLSMVAAGWMDGYWEKKLKPWDLAAGLLLVQEAGGRISNYQGTKPNLAQGEAVATNGLIHDQLLAALR